MTLSMKSKYLLYILLSAVSVPYLLLPERAGISVPLFLLLQAGLLTYLCPRDKSLLWLIPLFLLSLNYAISANPLWRCSNVFVSLLLCGILFCKSISITSPISHILRQIGSCLLAPFHWMRLPFHWLSRASRGKSAILKRAAIGVVIAACTLPVILSLLISADQVFSLKLGELFHVVFEFVHLSAVIKCLVGIWIALYLFGMLWNHKHAKTVRPLALPTAKGDIVILSAVLIPILAVYTLFLFIQIKYLFAGHVLPDGLSYTQYARKGFFELLTLSFINITLILVTIHLTRNLKKRAFLCCLATYLCIVTLVMLASSFYRMWLYCMDDALTRLRLMVFGFLCFEAVGLGFTFVYIWKPRFPVICSYFFLALSYYILLNLCPIDAIVAKSQVDRYFAGDPNGVYYATTLSADAARQIHRLQGCDADIQSMVDSYFDRISSDIPSRWQRWNLSTYTASQLSPH